MILTQTDVESWLVGRNTRSVERVVLVDGDQQQQVRLLKTRFDPVGLVDPTDPDGEPLPRARSCPRAIVDTDPEGHGLGIWVLVEHDAETCTYKYGGGIV